MLRVKGGTESGSAELNKKNLKGLFAEQVGYKQGALCGLAGGADFPGDNQALPTCGFGTF